jgi:hypothetical protein
LAAIRRPSSRRSSAEIAIDRSSSICSFFNMPRAAETNNVLLPIATR